jgi:hypothetical protein
LIASKEPLKQLAGLVRDIDDNDEDEGDEGGGTKLGFAAGSVTTAACK